MGFKLFGPPDIFFEASKDAKQNGPLSTGETKTKIGCCRFNVRTEKETFGSKRIGINTVSFTGTSLQPVEICLW